MSTITLSTIETLTKDYAAARAVVAERVNALDAEVREIHRRKVPGIKTAAAAAKDAQAKLVEAIKSAPELFTSPRTLTINGIKVGYQKGKGKLDWEDDDRVVALIRKFLPEHADLLINTTCTLSKDALKNLDVRTLAKIGVTAEAAGDNVVIRTSDSDVDKLVAKILKEGAVEEAAAA